jgi:PPOX class probable F420-dependent enzyme
MTMPTKPLPPEIEDLLSQPNPAVIATLRPDRQPVSVATWYLYENGRVLVNMDEGRKRIAHMRKDPRVSLTALKDGDWSTHVSIQGRVVEWVDDVDLSDIDRLSRHYGGGAYPDRQRQRISAWIEIERWHGWGAAKRS